MNSATDGVAPIAINIGTNSGLGIFREWMSESCAKGRERQQTWSALILDHNKLVPLFHDPDAIV